MTRTSRRAPRAPLVTGLVLATLGVGCGKDPAPEVAREIAQREAFGQALLEDAGAGRAWKLASRSDVLFEEGFWILEYDPPRDFRGNPLRWMGQNCRVRLKNHGDHAMKLRLYGWVDPKVLKTRPIVSAYVDGRLVGWTLALEDGLWGIENIVRSDMLRSAWVDLKITLSAVAFHWADPPELKVALLNGLEWTEINVP